MNEGCLVSFLGIGRSINPIISGDGTASGFAPAPHRLDESATGYSSAGCTPAVPVSASPAISQGEPGSRNCQSEHNTYSRCFPRLRVTYLRDPTETGLGYLIK